MFAVHCVAFDCSRAWKITYQRTACAGVLVAGQGEAGKAKVLFAGMGIGGLYQFLMVRRLLDFGPKSLKLMSRISGRCSGWEITPELLGVGYIIGPRIAAIMLAGGLLGWFIVIPLFTMFGQHISTPIFPETAVPLKDMGPWQIWSKYVRYIGAGGVAFAGIFALIKKIPMESFAAGLKGMGSGGKSTVRQNDLPMGLYYLLV